jgi:polysaccharide export outer membrane protein
MRTAFVVMASLILASSAAAQKTPRTKIAPGSRILLTVQGDASLSDTFTVSGDYSITLPTIGPVSVRDVEPSQLETHLNKVLSKYLRTPQISATVLMVVGVVGEVAHPGYYAVGSDAAVSEILMRAGGPTQVAKVTSIWVDRSGARAIEPSTVRRAISIGATADALGLQPGDVFTVPRAKPIDTEAVIRILAMAVTIPVAVYGFTRSR